MTDWKVAAVDFDYVHAAENLRMAHEHPDATVVGVCDENRERSADDVDTAVERFEIPGERVYDDADACLGETEPDIVLLSPATATHGEWVEHVADYDTHVVLEKPLAATLAEADRALDAMAESDGEFCVNWPLAWYPPHRTTKRLLKEGTIGEITEIHFYDGNRGPLHRGSDRTEHTVEEAAALREETWFYRDDLGGGSLLDYLGYGTTLATWFRDGDLPSEVTTTTDGADGLEVDEQSVTVARYDHGLSTFETRWGTFTDPWIDQPQPRCGFVVCGTAGTISSWDYDDQITVQTADAPEGETIPVDSIEPRNRNPIRNLIHHLDTGAPLDEPLTPELNRRSQRIVETARRSAARGEPVSLVE